MKRLILISALLMSSAAFAEGQKVTATVKGMVCGFCAQGITKKFKKEAAVDKLDVSLEKKIVTLDLKEGQDISDDKIKSLLEDAGYNVEKIERSGK